MCSYTDLCDTQGSYFQNAEFRLVEEGRVQPDPYFQYAMPQDFVDLASGTDANKLVDLMRLVSNL